METKTITDYEELVEFTMHLASNEKVAFDIVALPDQAGWIVKWIQLKSYQTYDNKEVLDEAWVTKDGNMINVQDIGLDHCRNIIRMMIRNQRDAVLVNIKGALDSVLGAVDDEQAGVADMQLPDDGRGKYLH